MFLGIIISFILALVSMFIANILPMNILSASVISLLLGMLLHPFIYKQGHKGINFTKSYLLKLAIILMGTSFQFGQVVSIGKMALIVMIFTLISAFGFGYLFGKLFKMDWKLSSLISAGTGICGGSAIAALSPVIEAKDEHVSYAISATFIFDIVMVLLFPIVGRWLMMSDIGFGLWAGTAINDTSSVVAASYAFSDLAGNYAIIVKLTRTLSIVPVVLIFSLLSGNKKRKIYEIFPWFILVFIIVVIINSFNIIDPSISASLSNLSKLLMVMSLGAIGLSTNFNKMVKSGFLPMLHGFIISLIVVLVSLHVQYVLNIM